MNITKILTYVNRTIMTNKRNEYIVIHYTGNRTDTAPANANYFRTVNRNASAHYFVDPTSIIQVVEDKDAAWHVGVNYGSNNLFGRCNNKNSIGIEMCSSNGRIADETFNNTVKLTKMLMKKYNIPADKVVRHYDVCSKRCPGWAGWLPGTEDIWNKFKKKISKVSSSKKEVASEPVKETNVTDLFKVRIDVEELNIRKGAGLNCKVVGSVHKGEVFTIIEAKKDWGKLKSGAGWISILDKYVTRI